METSECLVLVVWIMSLEKPRASAKDDGLFLLSRQTFAMMGFPRISSSPGFLLRITAKKVSTWPSTRGLGRLHGSAETSILKGVGIRPFNSIRDGLPFLDTYTKEAVKIRPSLDGSALVQIWPPRPM